MQDTVQKSLDGTEWKPAEPKEAHVFNELVYSSLYSYSNQENWKPYNFSKTLIILAFIWANFWGQWKRLKTLPNMNIENNMIRLLWGTRDQWISGGSNPSVIVGRRDRPQVLNLEPTFA